MKKISSKIIAGLLIFVFSLSPLTALRANAQWVVWDPGNFVPNVSGQVKDYGLDAVAWVIVNLIIERMSASTVNWINSGFKGSPAYVTDPSGYYSDIGNKVAGQFIFTNPKLNFLCGPISAKIRLTLAQNYIQDNTRWQCTLNNAKGNMQDFLNNFNNGGWEKFFELTQKPQNNPVGAYLMTEADLQYQIAKKVGEKKDILNWGNGFLSWSECVRYDEGSRATTTMPGSGSVLADSMKVYGPDGTPIDTYSDSKIPDSPPNCLDERINTPGSIIQSKLNDVLNIGNDKLAVADEVNEIVSALLTQLVNQVVGGVGRGLRGLSRPDSSNNNTSFTTQLINRAPGDTIEGYFGDKPNTTILDVPLDPSSVGIDQSKLVNPGDTVGGATSGGTGGILPNDLDCTRYSYDQIAEMARQDVASGLRATFEDAIINLDCPAN